MRISYLICATETFAKGMSCFDKSISIFLPRFGKVFLPKDSLLLIIMTKEKEERGGEGRWTISLLSSPLLFTLLRCSPLLPSAFLFTLLFSHRHLPCIFTASFDKHFISGCVETLPRCAACRALLKIHNSTEAEPLYPLAVSKTVIENSSLKHLAPQCSIPLTRILGFLFVFFYLIPCFRFKDPPPMRVYPPGWYFNDYYKSNSRSFNSYYLLINIIFFSGLLSYN